MLKSGNLLLAYMTITGADFPWIFARLTPGPDYHVLAPLLDELDRHDTDDEDLSEEEEDAARDAWFEALEAVNALDLVLERSRSNHRTRLHDLKRTDARTVEFKFA